MRRNMENRRGMFTRAGGTCTSTDLSAQRVSTSKQLRDRPLAPSTSQGMGVSSGGRSGKLAYGGVGHWMR